MASLMNGLSAMGAAVSNFAGAAGLEAQKADLAQQQTILADQLATTRETTWEGQREAFQGKQTEAEHGFLGAQGDLNRANQLEVSKTSAGATLGAAGIQRREIPRRRAKQRRLRRDRRAGARARAGASGLSAKVPCRSLDLISLAAAQCSVRVRFTAQRTIR